jgi:hypothetical protein
MDGTLRAPYLRCLLCSPRPHHSHRSPMPLLALARADSPRPSHAPPAAAVSQGHLHYASSPHAPTHVALKENVVNLCVKCFRCSRCMLQVFHMDIAKVDLNVVYVAVAIHVFLGIYSKFFIYFPAQKKFHLLQTCCKCFSRCCICCSGYTHMLKAHVTNVSFALDVCCKKCFHACCKCFMRRRRWSPQAKVVPVCTIRMLQK